jgi:hypothetical protein
MTLLGNQRNDNYNSRVQQSNYLREAENSRTSAANNRAAASNVLADADRQIGALKTSTILGTAASIVPFFSGGGSGGASSGTTSASGSGSGWGGAGWNNPYTFKGASGTKNFGLRFG